MPTELTPTVSIGLPVFNGERFVKFALDSLLEQTFQNFEVRISDNASTDNTGLICSDYASRDPRIKYHRLEKNYGASWNYNRVFAQAQGKYFKWMAHDDILGPHFLEETVDILENRSEISLCFSKTGRIDSDGNQDGMYDEVPIRFDSSSPSTRFRDIILERHHVLSVFGLIRSEVLRKTNLIESYVGSDRTLVAELALMGPLYEIPEVLWYRRDHPSTSVRAYTPQERIVWFDPEKSGRIHLPNWRKGIEFFHAVNRVSLPLGERLKCYTSILNWFRWNRRYLGEDIKMVKSQVLDFSGNPS